LLRLRPGCARTKHLSPRERETRVRFAYPGYISAYPSASAIIPAHHQPPITNHESRITDHESRITNHESRITNHESRITNHESPRNSATNACAARDSVRPPCTT